MNRLSQRLVVSVKPWEKSAKANNVNDNNANANDTDAINANVNSKRLHTLGEQQAHFKIS